MANYLAEIEQLSLSVDDLIDSESPIIIDTLTRNLIIQSNFNKQIAVEGDLSANEITFVCDRYIEGYDVFSADSAYIIWNNKAAGTEDAYLITNRELDGTNIFKFSWLISREVAKKAGAVECSVCFIDYADADRTIISYKWASNPLTGLTVGTSLPNTEIDEKEVVEEGEFERDPAEEAATPILSDSENEIVLNMSNRSFVSDINTQIAVEGDCYSSIITFKVNKKESDYNIEKANWALIKWSIGDLSDYSILNKINETNEYITYTWFIPYELTKKVGQITFAICFITTNTENKVISRWNSSPCSILSVGKSLNNKILDEATVIDFISEPIKQEELTEILEDVFDITAPTSGTVSQESLTEMLKEVFNS